MVNGDGATLRLDPLANAVEERSLGRSGKSCLTPDWVDRLAA